MKDKNNQNNELSEFTKIVSILLIFFFSVVAAYILFAIGGSLSRNYVYIIIFPIIGITSLIMYYLIMIEPVKSLKRLIIIDLVIFLLFLTNFLQVPLFLHDPRAQSVILSLSIVYYFYFILLIPLVGIILLTIRYLRHNTYIRSKKVIVVKIFLGLIIVLFVANYIFLGWVIPILQDVHMLMYT